MSYPTEQLIAYLATLFAIIIVFIAAIIGFAVLPQMEQGAG